MIYIMMSHDRSVQLSREVKAGLTLFDEDGQRPDMLFLLDTGTFTTEPRVSVLSYSSIGLTGVVAKADIPDDEVCKYRKITLYFR